MQFCDLNKQYLTYKEEIDNAIQSVLDSSAYINGPEVKKLEAELAEFSGAKHVIACANGTDALYIPLLAMDIKPGDEIIVPDFTFFATAEMVALAGATPIFADIDPKSFNITRETIESLITEKTKGIIPVSLFGQMPELVEINKLAEENGLWVMEDAAQSFGAELNSKRSCSHTSLATTSFFPAKPLGCYGDGGAIFVEDDALAEKIRIIVNHGSSERYKHKYIGVNSRLDSMQAAVLRVKLSHFEDELKNRDQAAKWYTEQLNGIVETPFIADHLFSAWAQYTIRVKDRETIQKKLAEKQIPTAVHYPIPLHKQECFKDLNIQDSQCPVSTEMANSVMSLPMHGMLTLEDVTAVCDAIKEAVSC